MIVKGFIINKMYKVLTSHILWCHTTNVYWMKAHYGGQKMSHKYIFWNCATFNFHQANIKRDFHKLYSK
jgi:hypothetical protein